jgi:hypothetical protein
MPGGDFYKRSTADRRVSLRGRAWNALLDAADRVKGGAHDLRADLAQQLPQAGVIYVRNDSGGPRQPFDVLGVTAPLVLPSGNLSEFQRGVALTGEVPEAADSHRFAVLLDALPAGAIGRAVVSGVVPGRVLVTPATIGYGCADVLPGDPTQLQLVNGGGTQVLWREGAFGTVNAVLRVGPYCAPFFPALPSGVSGSGSGLCCQDEGIGAGEDVCVTFSAPGTALDGLSYRLVRESVNNLAWESITDGPLAGALLQFYCNEFAGGVVGAWYLYSELQPLQPPGSVDTFVATGTLVSCFPSLEVTFFGVIAAGPDAGQFFSATVSGDLSACAPTSGGGGTGSGGPNCCAGDCGDPGVAATLTGTVTGATGCYASLPSTLDFGCGTITGGGHFWAVSPPVTICGQADSGFTVACFEGALSLEFFDAPAGGALRVAAQPGYTCSPFSAVFLVHDGQGNTMTVTVVS